MERSVLGSIPEIADSAFVSELAYAVGDVTVGEQSSLWPFVCLRGDGGPTVVGSETNVQEFSMLHGATIGDRVTIGHNVVIDYATVEDDSLIGMSSTVQRDAVIESNCLVAAGSLVTEGQTIPEGHLAYGAPAETRPIKDSHLEELVRVQELYVEHAETYKEGRVGVGSRNGVFSRTDRTSIVAA
ncbi:carbonic anhydrase/acetyltransferase-like protein (isoleucine patch superfamily) [Natrinema hispanicum]|uniref:Carbonic anhydrase/acetyltransferase-like protein (Isoleucine patch superfamily) n=1 Tax=Natrinema hispanicum TaxID=392421 RepID=A0A482Y5B4_9EURY|nr:gamma carbonic anhydrase family protein [Natrinema hispanicum]RZV06161.1 carbonic anhydrase/acetyltransferase-like protein (isoleucine patch superfamily) [Natrinema hispanicum]